MRMLPARSTRTDTFYPYTTPSRSPARPLRGRQRAGDLGRAAGVPGGVDVKDPHCGRVPSTRWNRDLPSPILRRPAEPRSEEHTSELQSLMRISYAVLCLKKKKHKSHSILGILHRTQVITIS